jgi:hypothetical protein
MPEDLTGLNHLSYGNGRFVATGNGTAWTEDGENWTTIRYTSGSFRGESWEHVTYGNGRFVAVGTINNAENTGNIGKAIWSVDGENWNTEDVPFTNSSNSSLIFGNGYFWNGMAWSPNGIIWASRNHYWHDAAYGNGRFVAFTMNDQKIAWSEDGVTWNASTNYPEHMWRLAYGNGRFVTIGGRAARSEDNGNSWIRSDSYNLSGIDWGAIGWGDIIYAGKE